MQCARVCEGGGGVGLGAAGSVMVLEWMVCVNGHCEQDDCYFPKLQLLISVWLIRI